MLGRIKQYLPPSSRSFHGLYREVLGLREDVRAMRDDIALLREELHRVRDDAAVSVRLQTEQVAQAAQAGERVDDLARRLDAHDAHMDLYAWQSLRREGERMADAKSRFFSSLPAACGSMRLLQLGCARLLHEFDDLCRENDLEYWVAFGTLLGAVRHGGFIPWDDDTDLGMMRDDIDRLARLVEQSERFRVSLVYDRSVFCRQLRLMYRDPRIPCFLDLFAFDYVTDVSSRTFDEQQALRDRMCAELAAREELSFWTGMPYLPSTDERSGRIEEVFSCYRDDLYGRGVLTHDARRAKGIVWGIDNLNDRNHYRWICELGDVFPTRELSFEGGPCRGPNNHLKFLDEVYGDIYSLPADIRSHFAHVSREELRSSETCQAMEEFFGSDMVDASMGEDGEARQCAE